MNGVCFVCTKKLTRELLSKENKRLIFLRRVGVILIRWIHTFVDTCYHYSNLLTAGFKIDVISVNKLLVKVFLGIRHYLFTYSSNTILVKFAFSLTFNLNTHLLQDY